MSTKRKRRRVSKPIRSKDDFENRVSQLHKEKRQRVCAKTDRLFMWLMLLQWMVAIVLAFVVSPRTWIGDTSHTHMHVYVAIFFGGLISLPPILLAYFCPGQRKTRIAIAFAQAAWSCVLIHLTGGRIETNFHAFGSLAFLAFYREWRLLVLNSVVILLDHSVRGSLWPASVYGVAVNSTWRLLEHAIWLTWINVFLIKSCLQQVSEERRSCKRQAQLEHTNTVIEDRVQRRTRELATTTDRLRAESVEHRKTQQERERAFRDLATASRRAGMAEVATGILHNVGNVLNSVNVAANVLLDSNRTSRVSRLAQASKIVTANESNLADFLTSDSRGRHFPQVLKQLADQLLKEQTENKTELMSLKANLEHVSQIVEFQQTFASQKTLVEDVSVCELVNDALKINSVDQQDFRVELDFAEPVPVIQTDKHKVLQILINLISNARHSLVDAQRTDATMRISVTAVEQTVRIQIRDNGMGISPDHMNRIFAHGFTTRESGHGFGLHSSALAAQLLRGSLSGQSDGIGKGATFTLAIPVTEDIPCQI